MPGRVCPPLPPPHGPAPGAVSNAVLLDALEWVAQQPVGVVTLALQGPGAVDSPENGAPRAACGRAGWGGAGGHGVVVSGRAVGVGRTGQKFCMNVHSFVFSLQWCICVFKFYFCAFFLCFSFILTQLVLIFIDVFFEFVLKSWFTIL